ncbi:methyl-accepting chemotaxis protein [Halosolutus halophilus]|uniref:methyl-accepting chemotaxis protein n=1 Tax=Halosolutus halophilus TaxID=1552990 RepID=UPI002234FFCF|nr:methyl-accepting chemotaxis protein [Halosolutus halophilus]
MDADIFESPSRAIRSRFSRKLAVLFLFVLLLIASIGGVIYIQTGAALQESTEQEMKQSTVLQSNTVGKWVDQTRERTRYLSESDRVASGDLSDIEAYLRDEHKEMSAPVAAIHYYDTAENEVLASTEEGATDVDYRDVGTEWAVQGIASENERHTTITHPYEDPSTATRSVAFVSQVPDDPERAIVLIVDLEAQTQQLERPSTADGSFTHIVDNRGTVVMSHHTEDINTQNMGSDDEFGVDSMAVERGLDGETGYMEMELDHGHGEQMAMGFTRVPDTDWVIMTHVPADSAYTLQSEIETSVIALVVLSLLGLTTVGVVIGRNTTRPIEQLARRASELETGNLETELETNRTDEIGQLYDAFDSMRTSLRERMQEVEDARARADRLNTHLEEKADEYADVMQTCGEGDLTQRMDPESQSEAMTEIAVEFNQMVSEIEGTVDRVSRFANEVAASSEQVTASTEEVHSASVQVTESIQEISDGAERQSENLQTVNKEMNDLSTTTEQIAASSNNLADLAAKTAQTGKEGQQVASEIIEEMNEVEADSERTIDAIESLEDEIAQIDELVEFITKVAKQTNMLALNANIEATRSVDSGDGFSAVAEEVKELAEETKEATEDIESRIEELKTETDRTASEVRQTSDRIARHRQAVENTVDVLEEIAEYANKTSDGVQEISAATQQQAASTQEVVSMVDQAATIAKATTEEAETVAAAGEEQTTALTEVSRSIDTLSQQASELYSKLDEFETEVDPENATDGDAASTPSSSVDAFSFVDPADSSNETDDRDAEPRDTGSGGGTR